MTAWTPDPADVERLTGLLFFNEVTRAHVYNREDFCRNLANAILTEQGPPAYWYAERLGTSLVVIFKELGGDWYVKVHEAGDPERIMGIGPTPKAALKACWEAAGEP
jgi:hypothetical protein